MLNRAAVVQTAARLHPGALFLRNRQMVLL